MRQERNGIQRINCGQDARVLQDAQQPSYINRNKPKQHYRPERLSNCAGAHTLNVHAAETRPAPTEFGLQPCAPKIQPTNIPTTVTSMAAVESKPKPRSQPRIVKRPMTRGFAVINIITIIKGTATIPLMTAVQ